MPEEWNSIEAAIRSGEADRVNDTIDRLESIELVERADNWNTGFELLTDLYTESEDGYVRQSVIRAVESISPGLASAAMAVDSTEVEIDEAALRTRLDTTSGFLLEALLDEDGRVRQSAIHALKACFRAYEALDDDETIDEIGSELEDLASEFSGSRREHILEAKEDAKFFSRPGDERMIETIRGLIQEAANRDR